MDKFERIADANALDEIRGTDGFRALVRLMMRKKDDLFTDWSTDKDLSKDFCKGALSVIMAFEEDVAQEIANGKELAQEQKEIESRIGRGQALEGGGTGDLA